MTIADNISENLCLIDWTNVQTLRNLRLVLDQTRTAEYQNNIVNYDPQFVDLNRYYKLTFMLQFMIGVLDILIYHAS